MIVERNDRALASVERQPETTQSARGDARTKLTPRSWEWSIHMLPSTFNNPCADRHEGSGPSKWRHAEVANLVLNRESISAHVAYISHKLLSLIMQKKTEAVTS